MKVWFKWCSSANLRWFSGSSCSVPTQTIHYEHRGPLDKTCFFFKTCFTSLGVPSSMSASMRLTPFPCTPVFRKCAMAIRAFRFQPKGWRGGWVGAKPRQTAGGLEGSSQLVILTIWKGNSPSWGTYDHHATLSPLTSPKVNPPRGALVPAQWHPVKMVTQMGPPCFVWSERALFWICFDLKKIEGPLGSRYISVYSIHIIYICLYPSSS